MSRIKAKELLGNAVNYKYTVGYFECWDLESVLGVVRAAESEKSPVIIGICGTYIGEAKRKYKEDLKVYYSMLSAIAEEASVPVALILNESDNSDMVKEAAAMGFDMVMYAPVFASEEISIEKMSAIQKEIVKSAHASGAFVEGEVGELPLFNSATGYTHHGENTAPADLKKFVAETGIDCVAVSVGNCHLKEDGTVSIDYDLLETLAKTVSIPLVLHGGTSIANEDLKRASAEGVAKVNFGTGMKRQVLNSIKEYLKKNDIVKMDPNDMLGRGLETDLMTVTEETIIQYVTEKIRALNSYNRV